MSSNNKSAHELMIEAQERACYLELERDKYREKAKTAGRLVASYKGQVTRLVRAREELREHFCWDDGSETGLQFNPILDEVIS